LHLDINNAVVDFVPIGLLVYDVISNLYILGTAVGHVDACEVKSTSSQKMGRGEESQMKSPPSEGGNVFEQFGNYMMMGEFEMSSEYTDVHQRSITENMNLLYVSPMEYSDYSVDQVHKSNDNNCVISSGGNATTCLATSSGAKGPLSEVETSDLDANEMVFAGKLICFAK
jgi:hypothetical protein